MFRGGLHRLCNNSGHLNGKDWLKLDVNQERELGFRQKKLSGVVACE